MDLNPNHQSAPDDQSVERWQVNREAIDAARLDAARRALTRRPMLKGLLAGATLLAFGGQDLQKILAEGGAAPAFAQAQTTTLFGTTTAQFVTTTLFSTTTAQFVTTTLFSTTTAQFVTTTLFNTTTAPFVTTTLFNTTTAPFVTTTLFSTTTAPFVTTTSFVPPPGSTPEVDSLLLFGGGVAAMAAYGMRRLRGTSHAAIPPLEDQPDD